MERKSEMTEECKFGLLSQIEYPSDLRRLKVEQLPEVCKELRQDIIDQPVVQATTMVEQAEHMPEEPEADPV